MVTWEEDQADKVCMEIEGVYAPDIESIVVGYVQKSAGPVKREELVHDVSVKTGISKSEVHEHLSDVLRKLVKHGRIVRTKVRGFYMPKQPVAV